MKIIGLIAEYNPFHLGHLYQINKIKELYPDSLIIAIISTNFTERGDISIINKWNKTKLSLEYGIDLVVELPSIYATQSSDIFAKFSLSILNQLHIDTLVFGSESNDINMLTNLANTQLHDKNYNPLVQEYLNQGYNYPTATNTALEKLTGTHLESPNDLLGLSYIKEILANNYHITPITIKRTNNYHDKNINSNIINATLIRELYLNNKDISNYVPNNVIKYLYPSLSINNAYNLLKYNIINNQTTLSEYLTVDEGIENRIIKNINKSNSWNELINNIKTKRYTYNKINRMLLHILLNNKKEDNIKDIYIKVLGFNSKGKKYLNNIKKTLNMPICYGYKKDIAKSLDYELKSTYIYSLITNDNPLIEREYQNKPIIYK